MSVVPLDAPALSLSSQSVCWLSQDQLRQEMAAGRIFKYLHEAAIGFQPTYKFDKLEPDPLAYDSSEKQRVPAWTDRIFFRGSELSRQHDHGLDRVWCLHE